MSDAPDGSDERGCVACGAPLPDGSRADRTRVVDGSVEYRWFCDGECRRRWEQ